MNTPTITPEQQQSITDWLTAHPVLTVGVGTKESACTVAAINLALTGRLTDDIPECMSPVIGRWIIRIQDAMPHNLRNSDEWRALIPLAAGTGRDPETEKARLDIILDWMFGTVLVTLQPLADENGYGEAWQNMTTKRTAAAADAAAYAAADAAYAGYAAADAADAAAAAWDTFNPAGLLQTLINATRKATR